LFRNFLYSWIKDVSPDLFVYLCMETPEVWQDSLGFTPESDAHLSTLMDQQARKLWQ